MVEMARFIKPILAIVPPDLTGIDPAPVACPLAGLAAGVPAAAREAAGGVRPAHDDERADFLRQWFETDPLIATMSASGIIGTYQGVQSPGTAYVLLHHYMGEIDGAFRAWGIPQGRHRAASRNAIGSRGAGARRRDPAGGAGRPDRRPARPGRPASCSSRARRSGRGRSSSSVDARLTYLGLIEPGTLEPEFEEEVRRFKFRGSSGKVNLARRPAARLHVPARRGRAPARRDQLQRRASTTWSGPTTTPSTAAVERGRTST